MSTCYRVVAEFLIVWTILFMTIPGLCESLFPELSRATGDARPSITADSFQTTGVPTGTGTEEDHDCLCCCAHVVPVQPFEPSTSFVRIYFPPSSEYILFPELPQVFFHPPRG